MNAPVLSRRHLLGATAALSSVALPILAEAGIPAALPADSDAELLDLIARHGEAWDACERAEVEAVRIDALARAAEPPRPEALQHRKGDFPRTSLGFALSETPDEDAVRWYGGRAAAWMRDRPAAMWFPKLVPALGPECEARRVEILAAWDAWRTDVARIEAALGLPAAEEACTAAAQAYWLVDDALGARQPVTMAGLRAKAAWVLAYAGRGGLDINDVAVAFASEVAAFGGAAS